MAQSMAVGSQAEWSSAESSWSRDTRNELGFGNLKAHPSDNISNKAARSNSSVSPMGSQHSNLPAYGDHSHSDHHTRAHAFLEAFYFLGSGVNIVTFDQLALVLRSKSTFLYMPSTNSIARLHPQPLLLI